MKILLNAVPFGYGPVSKILTVAKKLKAGGAELTFCGSGIAYDFMRREQVCDTVHLNLYEEEGARQLAGLSASFDYALTAMEPLFVKHLPAGVRRGYIDSLFWMWDTGHFDEFPELFQTDHYFVQNTFIAEQRSNNLPIRNPVVVGGIIDIPARQPEVKRRAVVHFGGIENIFNDSRQIRYPYRMMELLEQASWETFDEVIVVCGERFAGELRQRGYRFADRIVSLPHDEFMRLLADSALLITTPGLTTLLEAYAMGIETVFLPPQNYSQHLILNYLLELSYPVELLNWSLFDPSFRLDPDMPEKEAVMAVQSGMEAFFDDDVQTKMFLQLLHSQIHDAGIHRQIGQFQREFIHQTGTDGADRIAATVLGVRDEAAHY
ncbi:hypothetical protein [Paenibacillus oleatilyticus]|uniref:hypothetical protein n=1 Tax=Paenibacillus oleatilyticus TaxID=2594886 RepID=UPI001C1F57F4|nr:hypothetical protein [Paenibacillus oleatilyticus]MBU7315051.1 hypothetical protein [Paenibacillus oleatilyticus]